MKNEKKPESQMPYLPIYMCLGISVGMAIGAAMDNIPIGMTIGMGVGMCIGSALDAMKRKKADSSSENDQKDEKK